MPVLLLTAMAEPEDRINGLEQGADDYLAKPFEPRELVLRIRNILQRRAARAEEASAAAEIRFGGFRFDLARGELFRGGDLVRLTAAETALLTSLAQRAPARRCRARSCRNRRSSAAMSAMSTCR